MNETVQLDHKFRKLVVRGLSNIICMIENPKFKSHCFHYTKKKYRRLKVYFN